MATVKQKLLFKEFLNAVESGEFKTFRALMNKLNYSKNTKTEEILKSRAFQDLLKQIDDRIILARIYHILLDEDKRASLEAADKLLKLKDRYPKQKLTVELFEEELNKLQ